MKCKICEVLGCSIEGITGICPICEGEYCLGHLDNHEHKMSQVRAANLRVIGVGRIGSYAKAKQSHRCRNHRYWAIGYFDCRERIDTEGMKVKGGMPECSDSPHFKTKKECECWLRAKLSPHGEVRP